MTKILVAGDCDSPEVGREIEAIFREAGYEVHHAPARKDLLNGRQSDVDLVIIDATRDGKRGRCFASCYRSCSSVGIIVIHQAEVEPDPIRTLELGADDVLTRPFQVRELLVRVNSLLRRMDLNGHDHMAGRQQRGVEFEGWFLDLERRQLASTNPGEAVPLTAAEYDMLVVFLQNPCRVLTRDDLSMFTLGRSHTVTGRTLDIQVGRLRKKLSTNNVGIKYIRSVRNKGYVFCGRTKDVY